MIPLPCREGLGEGFPTRHTYNWWQYCHGS
jgi:hypothetical protein